MSSTVPSILASPHTNTTFTSGDDTSEGDSYYTLPSQYLSLIVLFGGFFLITGLVAVVASRSRNRNNANHNTPDPEVAYPSPAGVYLGTFQDAQRVRALFETVSPATPFKKLTAAADPSSKPAKGTNNKTSYIPQQHAPPPDQSGSTVTCVICLDEFKPRSILRRLLCGHLFHAACIDEWLLQKKHCNCPLCNMCYLPEGVADNLPAVPGAAVVAGAWPGSAGGA